MLPFYYWDIYVSNVNVGKISLRIGRNSHSYYNGNIGYEIFPEYRGNSYAYTACRMVLGVASYKTIERLGAELIEIKEVPKEYFAWREGMPRQRIYRYFI